MSPYVFMYLSITESEDSVSRLMDRAKLKASRGIFLPITCTSRDSRPKIQQIRFYMVVRGAVPRRAEPSTLLPAWIMPIWATSSRIIISHR